MVVFSLDLVLSFHDKRLFTPGVTEPRLQILIITLYSCYIIYDVIYSRED